MFLAVFATLSQTLHHECVHKEMAAKYPPQPFYPEGNQDPQFLNFIAAQRKIPYDESIARPMKVHFVTDLLKTQTRNEDEYNFLVNQVIPTAKLFYESRLKVNHYQYPWQSFEGHQCAQVTVPKLPEDLDADIVLYATAKLEPTQGYVAWATPCFLDPNTNRPISGQVNFNLAYIKTSNADFIGFSKVTLHEIFHVMGFSPPLYEQFVSPEGFQYEHDEVLAEYTNSVGAKSLALKTPKLVAFAKDFYQCDDIVALPLENDGDAGSAGAHFERAVFFNEVMTASTIKDQVFSGFGFSLLADSGWYGVDRAAFEDFQAGKGMGCDWFGSCHVEQNQQMFCAKEGEVGCNWDYTAVGQCSDFFLTADQCRQIQPYDNFNCNVDDYSDMSRQLKEVTKQKRGPNARCLQTTIVDKRFKVKGAQLGCYDAFCTEEGEVVISIEGQNKTCSEGKSFVHFRAKTFEGDITCPDQASFCRKKFVQCPNFCSAHGYCGNGQCQCLPEWTGEDCGQHITL